MTDTRAAETGCWIHRGTVKPNGYGSDGGRSAHVVAYERVFGAVPAGSELHHACGNRLCVNPAHLIALTRRQHHRLHAATITTCPKGHAYSPSNTRFRPNGSRQCITCDRASARDYARRRYATDPTYRAAKIARAR